MTYVVCLASSMQNIATLVDHESFDMHQIKLELCARIYYKRQEKKARQPPIISCLKRCVHNISD